MRPTLLAALIVVIFATSCGSSNNDPAVTIGDAETLALADWNGSGMTDSEMVCVITDVLNGGVDLASMATDSLTPTEDGVIATAILDCIEDPSRIDRLVQPLVDELAAAGTPVTFEQGRCAVAAIAAMGSDGSITDPAEPLVLTPEAAEAVLDCMAQAGPGAIDTYGDDAVFDGLWDSCAGGDNSACDLLYETSPLVSGYEDFGRTCGGVLPDSIGLRCVTDLEE